MSILTTENDDARLEEIARGGIERGADWKDDASSDAIYDDAYALALDALLLAGTRGAKARDIAAYVAQKFAQP